MTLLETRQVWACPYCGSSGIETVLLRKECACCDRELPVMERLCQAADAVRTLDSQPRS
jgi:hypothetical protein